MIITCGKCDTSYELNESLVKETGSKVRCKNCGHVFTVFPPSTLTAIEPEPDLELESVVQEPPAPGKTRKPDLGLEMTDLEKMLESQTLVGPDSLKITGDEPELSLADEEEKPATVKPVSGDDLDFLDLSDIEKMLDTAVTQGPESIKISGQEEELSLEMASDAKAPGDALDFSDIEKLLDTEVVKGPESLNVSDQEEELSLEMEPTPLQAAKTTPVSKEEALELTDLEGLLEIEEDTRERKGVKPADEDLGLILEMEDSGLSRSTPSSSSKEDLEESLDLDFDDELKLDEDLEGELKLEMEGEEEPEFKLAMDTEEELDLKLEMEKEETSDLDLDLDLEDLDESKAEEEDLFEIQAPAVKTQTLSTPSRVSGTKAQESVFELDLEEPDEPSRKPEKKPEGFVLKGEDKAKADAFALGAGAPPSRKKEKPKIAAPKARKKSGALAYVFLLLLILAGGALGYLQFIGIKITDLSSLASLLPEQGKIAVVETSLRNEFVENTKAGTLLVITGNVENKFNKARSRIRISVDVLGIDKVVIKTDSVFCGNLLKKESLANDDLPTMKRVLMKPDGTAGANLNVKPGARVPFMAVFADLPGSVKEFQVKVMDSEPAKK